MTPIKYVKIGSLLLKIHRNNDFKKRKIKKNIYNYGFTEPFLLIQLYIILYCLNYNYSYLYIIYFTFIYFTFLFILSRMKLQNTNIIEN